MFEGAYTDSFYRALRDALHAEVDSWTATANSPTSTSEIWRRLERMETLSRNPNPTFAPTTALISDELVQIDTSS
jgi:hypothetical protein